MNIEVINCFCNITQSVILLMGLILLLINLENRIFATEVSIETNIQEYRILKQEYDNLLLNYRNLIESLNNKKGE